MLAHIPSCDATSHSFLREIPQCWLTGQAAGAAAALAANGRIAPRAVSVPDLQRELRRQGVYLRLPGEITPAHESPTPAIASPG